MTRLRSLLLVTAVITLPACNALRDAMGSHVDVVARAGSSELTIEQLAQLMLDGNLPLQPEIARSVVQIWTNYTLLGTAAARGDSLASDEDADRGMWSAADQQRLQLAFERFAESMPEPDSAGYEAAYNRGELLAAAHILLSKRPEGLGLSNDSVRREAEALAGTVTAANFARIARARSEDPGSKERGGDYGVFPPGTMVPEFDAGILSVPPGGITGVVETQFGYHIIRRSTFEEVRDQFAEAYRGLMQQRAESLFFASAEEGADIEVKRNAARLVKAIALDVDSYRDDRAVLATSRRGDLTAARMADWLAAFPPQTGVRRQLQELPDSIVPEFVMNIMRNELLLKRADSLGVTLDSATRASMREAFRNVTWTTMGSLGLSPGQLADSADAVAEREAVAQRQVLRVLREIFRQQRDYVEVPEQISLVLRGRYETRVVTAALDRAVQEAERLRAAADSAAAATRPPSAVPMPSGDSTP